ncbi:F-box/kelch-repeat protein At3g06240-like [Solanum dulcamara]|uniref:F-box/kelch-repeat protein At3g06240-like n=1 Tax=Solanum dulcamara TaxID=45834 RepID=UPI0024868B64|nr:F-box/kelch-repeat protein At3g06240-like [Solanum dulcamara]
MGKMAKLFKSIMTFDCFFIGTSSKKKDCCDEEIKIDEVNSKPSKNIIEDVDGVMEIYFPEEIIVEILIRLLVQSLLRFKCVLKSWKMLITSNYFKAKHCNHARNNKKILIYRWLRDGTISYYCSSLSSAQPAALQKLGACPSNHHYEILCCYDGLSLLLSRDGYLLWNSSTNESIQLPNIKLRHISRSTYEEASVGTYGLGYDSITDDYKILKIDNLASNKILALKSGSWRNIDNIFYNYTHHKDTLIFVRGAFHWICRDIRLPKYFMLSFNISNEVYTEILLPDEICKNMPFINRVASVIEGMLCAYCTRLNEGVATFKLWVMKDYGIKESWTLLYTI